MTESNLRLLIVGNPDPIHVGAHLLNAARSQERSVEFCDSREAYDGAWPVTKINWWLRGRRPSRLEDFGRKIVDVCRQFRPQWLLTTGLSPVPRGTLEEVRKLGMKRLNFLTDDPWNPAHRTSWFMHALTSYDHVFTPRRANISDLRGTGCRAVSYLPFAYAPELHFPDPPATPEDRDRYDSDVVFAGGADSDRVPLMAALINSGVKVALYGGYWRKHKVTRGHALGHADPPTLRKAIGGSRVAICLVRRANRDGHSMRTYEVPAVGACMLVEDTAEHREIFGKDMVTVAYFDTVGVMLTKLRWLLENDSERARMANAAHELITNNGNTYLDRLKLMLE